MDVVQAVLLALFCAAFLYAGFYLAYAMYDYTAAFSSSSLSMSDVNHDHDQMETFQASSSTLSAPQEVERVVRTTPSSIFDSFYCRVYDELFHSQQRVEFEVYNILQVTKPSPKSTIVDLGCGTGRHLTEISKHVPKTTQLIAVDISHDMLLSIKKKHPDGRIDVIQSDFMSRTTLSPASADILLCLFFSPCYAKDIDAFFANCKSWLKFKGYVCIHLVHKNKFDPVLERASKLIPLYHPQRYRPAEMKKRRTKTTLVFNKFNYASDWSFSGDDQDKEAITAKFIERFRFDDALLREQTHTLYMYPLTEYVRAAERCQLSLVKIIDLVPVGHDYSYIYIFQNIDASSAHGI